MSRTILKKQNKAMVSLKKISNLGEIPLMAKCSTSSQRVGSFNNVTCAVVDFRTALVVRAAKAKVVAKLELAHRKLRETHQELREAVLLALDLKKAGDDIADQVIESVAEIAPTINKPNLFQDKPN